MSMIVIVGRRLGIFRAIRRRVQGTCRIYSSRDTGIDF
jgi:hypothetical protein